MNGVPMVPIHPSDATRKIDDLRTTLLFGGEVSGDAEIPITPLAEQHYLLALAALEQARSHMKLADYLAMRGE